MRQQVYKVPFLLDQHSLKIHQDRKFLLKVNREPIPLVPVDQHPLRIHQDNKATSLPVQLNKIHRHLSKVHKQMDLHHLKIHQDHSSPAFLPVQLNKIHQHLSKVHKLVVSLLVLVELHHLKIHQGHNSLVFLPVQLHLSKDKISLLVQVGQHRAMMVPMIMAITPQFQDNLALIILFTLIYHKPPSDAINSNIKVITLI